MWQRGFRHTALVVAIAAAMAMGFMLGVASAAGQDTTPRCTHGLSSIGPVEIKLGQVVGGDAVPHTEACLR